MVKRKITESLYKKTFTAPYMGADYKQTFTAPYMGADYKQTSKAPYPGADYKQAFTADYKQTFTTDLASTLHKHSKKGLVVCPHCGSKEFVKNGVRDRMHVSPAQMYKCTGCQHKFTDPDQVLALRYNRGK
jgi:DNA-directed RNA polymerase subunit RPC12/RpoP